MRNDPQLGGIAWIPRNKSQVDVVESSVHPTGPRTLVFIFLMIQLTWVESSESQRVVMKKEPSVGLVLSEQGVHRSWTIDKRDDRSWSSADDNSRPTAISVMNCTNINIQSMNFCKKKRGEFTIYWVGGERDCEILANPNFDCEVKSTRCNDLIRKMAQTSL